jgi:Na+-transporting NADH:ubiquinone oxidoreductase subunit NqrD
LVLVSQRGQVLTVAEAVSEAAAILAALPGAVALAVAISAVVAFAQLQVSLVARALGAAIEQHRLFVAVVHTLPGEIIAD